MLRETVPPALRKPSTPSAAHPGTDKLRSMTKRITHIAKPLLPATLTLSALLSMTACGSSAAKPSAAASTSTAVSAPTTTPSQPGGAPGAGNPTGTPVPGQASTQPQAPAQAKNTASKPSKPASSKPQSNSGGDAHPVDCTIAHLKGTVTGLTNPINHVLLTVTNTGTATCSLYYYPDLRLDADQQAVTQAVEDSKPQAVVTIAPGESAYAAIGTSSADGSGSTPQLEKQVDVLLEARDQSGSLPGTMTLPLPAGTYVDLDKAFVTYWQSDLQSATSW